jgi:hypothetical protein
MKRNFLQTSVTSEKISLVVITVTACLLVYLFLPAKPRRDCDPRIVKVETFYNPGTAPSGTVSRPEDKLAVQKVTIRTGVKKKNKKTVVPQQDLLVLLYQLQGEQKQVAAIQIEQAWQQLLEGQLELQEAGAERSNQ